jgi:Domain of unknown function (DUF1918)
MSAHVGDRLLVKDRCPLGHHRICRVTELRGPGGEAPYLVEWYDTGDVALFDPDPGVAVVNCEPSRL